MMPFTEGLAVRSGGLAKVKRGRYAPLLMWMVGLVAFLVALGEALLRMYAPTMSYRFYAAQARCRLFAGLDRREHPRVQVTYRRRRRGLSIYCGLIGTGLMVIAAIYPIFRRIKVFRWLASNTMWFDFHLMAGIVGPMFIMLHSALKLDTWVSAPRSGAWRSSSCPGFLGRYLYTQVPELLERRRARGARSRARVPGARAPHCPVPMAEIDRELGEQRAQRAARRAVDRACCARCGG